MSLSLLDTYAIVLEANVVAVFNTRAHQAARMLSGFPASTSNANARKHCEYMLRWTKRAMTAAQMIRQLSSTELLEKNGLSFSVPKISSSFGENSRRSANFDVV